MTIEEIAESIGYCGLVCKMCKLCDGCKSGENCCAKHVSAEGCYQYGCCNGKGFNGCWECNEFPCNRDMFAGGNIRLKAFVRCAREEGVLKLAEYLKRNADQGIQYHKDKELTGDYDGFQSEQEVLLMLRTGKRN